MSTCVVHYHDHGFELDATKQDHRNEDSSEPVADHLVDDEAHGWTNRHKDEEAKK